MRVFLLILLFAFPVGLFAADSESKQTESKSKAKSKNWYLYNSFQRSSLDSIFLPNGSGDLISTSYMRNYLFLSYRFNQSFRGYGGFAFQVFESDLSNPSFGQRFGDGLFGAGWTFFNQSAQSLEFIGSVKVPLSDYPASTLSALGDGQVDIIPSVVHKWNFSLFGNYSQLKSQLGYNLRLETPPDQLTLRSSLTVFFLKWLGVTAGMSMTHSLDGTNYGSDEFNEMLIEGDAEGAYISLQTIYYSMLAGFNFRITNDLDSFIGFSQVLFGENAANTQTFQASLGYSF